MIEGRKKFIPIFQLCILKKDFQNSYQMSIEEVF